VARTLSIVTVLAVALAAAPAQAKCARVLLVPQVLTHPGDPIPKNGGILVGWDETTDGSAERYEGHDPAVNPDWIVMTGPRRQRPKIEVLAPGLAVYRARPVAGGRGRSLVLREGGAKLGTWTATTKTAAKLATAPRARAITTTTTQSTGGRGPREITVTSLALDAPAPTSAAAVIAYRVVAGQATPIAWARVAPGRPDPIELYSSPGRCSSEPDGLIAPQPGEQVALAWVDSVGNLSPRSAPIAVR
jgi:hypothetical protein